MQNISKNFFGVRVLFDVNFSVRRGEVHALLGENGAGKSTLTKILSAVYRKESGEIILDGKPLHAERAQAVIERQQEDRLQHDGREKACPDGNAPRPARQHERRGKHGPVQQLQVLPDALVHR